jgi:hypothetical protein
MDVFLTVHRYLRFVILAAGILGVLRSLVSLGSREALFMRVDNVLMRLYTGALDLQLLAGVVLAALLLSESEPVRWIHPLIMVPALWVAHLSRRYRAWPGRDRHGAHLRIYLISLVLIAMGLLVIGELRLL